MGLVDFSALTLFVGQQEGHPARKKYGGWWRWALVSPEGVASSRMVSVSASVNLPLHHKVQKMSSGIGSPGWSQKKDRKTVVCVCVLKWWVLITGVPLFTQKSMNLALVGAMKGTWLQNGTSITPKETAASCCTRPSPFRINHKHMVMNELSVSSSTCGYMTVCDSIISCCLSLPQAHCSPQRSSPLCSEWTAPYEWISTGNSGTTLA